ncbi:MAG: hypothetical protein ACRCUY_05370 [Thermoguttaceae bacterium]
MMANNRFGFIFLFLVVCTCFLSTMQPVYGQPLRRLLSTLESASQGIPNSPGNREQNGPVFPLIQGDGRFFERATTALNLVSKMGTNLRPVAIISSASLEEMEDVVTNVIKEIKDNKGTAEQTALLEGFLLFMKSISERGFDTKRPFGLVIQTDDLFYYPLFFAPINPESVSVLPGISEYLRRLPDGRIALRDDVVNWPFGPLFLREQNGWMYVVTEAQFRSLPNDPRIFLRGLPPNMLIWAQFDLQQLPQLTNRAAFAISESRAVALAKNNLELATTRLGMEYLRMLSQQVDYVGYSLSYNKSENEFILKQNEIVKPNSPRSQFLQARRNAVSPFHGFYFPENAIFASHIVTDLSPMQQFHVEMVLDELVGKRLLTQEERSELNYLPVYHISPVSPVSPVSSNSPLLPISPGRIGQPQESPRLAPEQPPITPEQLAISAAKSSEIGYSDEARDQLVNLLSRVPVEELERMANDESKRSESSQGKSVKAELPDLVLSDAALEELSNSEKLEAIMRRVGVVYYWGLIGSIRVGAIDGATTISTKDGILGGYRIADGKRFIKTYDQIFVELQTDFPEVSSQCIQKNYREVEGFRLTKITFRVGEVFKKSMWRFLLPMAISQKDLTLILGVRDDAICFCVGEAGKADERLLTAINNMHDPKQVRDTFFVFSAYQLAQSILETGVPNQLLPFQDILAQTKPAAKMSAESNFGDNSRNLTLQVSGFLVPLLGRLRESVQKMTSQQ